MEELMNRSEIDRQFEIMETAKKELKEKGYFEALEKFRASDEYQREAKFWHERTVDSIATVSLELANNTPYDSYENDIFGNLAISIAELFALMEITTEDQSSTKEIIEEMLKKEMLLMIMDTHCAEIAKKLVGNAVKLCDELFWNWFTTI